MNNKLRNSLLFAENKEEFSKLIQAHLEAEYGFEIIFFSDKDMVRFWPKNLNDEFDVYQIKQLALKINYFKHVSKTGSCPDFLEVYFKENKNVTV